MIERLARSRLLRGDAERGRDLAHEAIALLERVGHRVGLSRAYTVVGIGDIHLGRPREAAAAFTRARAITDDVRGLVTLEH